MRIAVSSDERTGVAETVVEELRRRGHEPVPHGDHVDYLVDGTLHSPHGGHCDDHGAADHT